jgi:peptide/nickel transport system ATP-binding protein
MADHVLVLKDGRAGEYGGTQQVLQAPENAYTKKLMSAVPRLKRMTG